MPDWVIHIGAGYLLSRRISRQDVSWALIGSILPDVVSRIEVILIDFLHIFFLGDFSFGSFHTPFMLACLSAAVALLTIRPGRTFAVLFGFSMLHIFLDMSEVHVPGFGVLLLFPFSYNAFSFNLLHFKGIANLTVYGLFLLVLLQSFIHKHTFPNIRWSARRFAWSLPIFFFLALFPFRASRMMFEHNVGYIQFLKTPEVWEGKKVGLHVSRVVSLNPAVVDEAGNLFEVETDRDIRKGDWISLYGTYRKGKITSEIIIPEMGSFKKSLFSAVGLLFLIGFFAL
jgi:hypothetical protein